MVGAKGLVLVHRAQSYLVLPAQDGMEGSEIKNCVPTGRPPSVAVSRCIIRNQTELTLSLRVGSTTTLISIIIVELDCFDP